MGGGPLEFQLASMNWTAEEAPAGDAQVWAAPAGGLPNLEYASIVDIFGGSSCSLQPYAVPAPGGGQQQQADEYNYYAAAAQLHDHPTGKATTTHHVTAEELCSDGSQEDLSSFDDKKVRTLLWDRTEEFIRDRESMKKKMHRYPPNIRDLGESYTVPKVVAIGPYHRHHDKLKPAEKMKLVAVHNCIEISGLSVREMYHAVKSVAGNARDLYDKDVMEGIHYENEFLPMMFYDACFLVMCMLNWSQHDSNNLLLVLSDFFESNAIDIAHDIMLLENQIPWPVVDAITKKMKLGHFLEEFISDWKDGSLVHRRDVFGPPPVEFDEEYEPPHLLGLVWFYTVATRTRKINNLPSESELENGKSVQISASAIELAEMGIHLTANETTELSDMGLASKWIIFAKIFMAPLSLDDSRASLLVNMAALELCTAPDFFDSEEGEDPKYEDSAVCSYLLLLCMLMHKEDDVHELRRKGILQGGAGLTNKKALDFFTSLQRLRRGYNYALLMIQIHNYRNKRPWIKVYAFIYRNWKIITGIVSAIAGFVAILKKLESLKGAHN